MRKVGSGIYGIRNAENNKIYIGSAVSLASRRRIHKHHLKKGDHHNKYLQAAYDKYGESTLVFSVIEIVSDKNMLLEREQYWIDRYESLNREKGYNLAPVAESMLGFNHTEETKKKLSEYFMGHTTWNKGIKMSGQYRENFLVAMRSDERKQKRRKKSDGFKHTEETKKKIGMASVGRPCSEETRRKMAATKTGKPMPAGHRENCIEAWKIRKLKKANEGG